MNSVVLDASAVLTLIGREPGWERLTPKVLNRAVCSTVNLAEVQAKLVSRGWPPDDAWEDATAPIKEAISFTDEQAKMAGSLVALTRHLGLSLGDRACLALAITQKATVYTTEKAWNKLTLGIRIQVIR